MVKKLTYKLLLLLLLLVGMNLFYRAFFFEKDIQQYSDVVNQVREIPLDATMVYIGESSNTNARPTDSDKRSISAFVGDFFPGLGVYDITKPASHAGIYKVLLAQIPEESEVETVVVTLNLRSFNAQWIHSELETPLLKSLILLKQGPPLYNRGLLSFKAYPIHSEKEWEERFKKQWVKAKFHPPFPGEFSDVKHWDKWMFDTGVRDSAGNYDWEQTPLACHYIKGYGFQIDPKKNPRVADFDELVKLAEKRKWKLVFNLLAENTDKARELVGEDLLFLINENARFLKDRYSAMGVLVVDNLYEVEDEQFTDQNWTTEHYGEKGRKTVAANVARALKDFYPEFFNEMDY